jgi:hypothetical protein
LAGRRPEPCASWCIRDNWHGGRCLYCGWTKQQIEEHNRMGDTPHIWDVAADENRTVTQADVDMLMATAKAYANVRAFIDQEQARFLEEIKSIRSRAGLPHA